MYYHKGIKYKRFYRKLKQLEKPPVKITGGLKRLAAPEDASSATTTAEK